MPAADVKLLRRSAAWMLSTALVTWVLAGGVDIAFVTLRTRVGGATLSAGWADGAALTALVTLLGAPLAAGLEVLCVRIATAKGPWRAAWPVPIALAAGIAALVVSPGLALRGRAATNTIVVIGFALVVTALAIATRATQRHPWLAVASPVAVLVAALWADFRFGWLRPAHQDLLTFASVGALVGLATPLRRHLRRAPSTPLVIGATIIVAASCVDRWPREDALSRWRRRSDELGRIQPTLRRSLRAIWDVDLDGSSPIFGGGDCDDGDALRNPRARELPNGLDNNCNGVIPPPSPTIADRGLTPAFGTPEPLGGPVDFVLLVTIDCMRADALDADVTPNMWKLASRGLRMSHMHSAGSKTVDSLPLVQRVDLTAEPIALRLHSTGITSTAIVATGVLGPELLDGFDRKHIPPGYGERWTAEASTDLALADLESSGARHYLWVHYYDAHDPIDFLPGDVDRGPLPGSYVRQIRTIDRELGRLLDALDRRMAPSRVAILVTADHGEALGAHGIPFHAGTPYEPLTHVPAIFVAPGIRAGVHEGLVSHRDVPLTILAALGVDVGSAEQFGRSWFRLQGGQSAPLHSFVVSSGSASGMSEQREWVIGAIVEPRLKLIERYDVRSFALFDPIADPGEDDDLADAEQDETARMRRELATFRDLDPRP